MPSPNHVSKQSCTPFGQRGRKQAGWRTVITIMLVQLLLWTTEGRADSWTATGSLGTARFWHTVTLLSNGKVLAAGGYDGLASAELYDPAGNSGAGAWAGTGSLNTGRRLHTATLLPSGKVLVTGGSSGGPLYSSAELFDPTGNSGAGSWTTTANMSVSRDRHTATLLPNGKVLVVGGGNGSGQRSSAELFDPAGNSGAGSWTTTGSMAYAREFHTATLLPNGKVLVAGGFDGDDSITSAELFDPAGNSGAGSWTTTGSLNVACKNHTATLLPNGKVLVAGGRNYTDDNLESVQLYDPANGTWINMSPMNVERSWHTATLLPNGKVLVASGDGGESSAELYDVDNDTWTETDSLLDLRNYAAATLLPNGKVLIVGGCCSISSAELFQPTLWTPADISPRNWYEADSYIGVLSDGDTLSGSYDWVDAGSAGWNAHLSIGSGNGAKWESSELNGHSVVRFAINQTAAYYLKSGGAAAQTFSRNLSALTIIAVAKPTGAGTVLVSQYGSGPGTPWHHLYAANNGKWGYGGMRDPINDPFCFCGADDFDSGSTSYSSGRYDVQVAVLKHSTREKWFFLNGSQDHYDSGFSSSGGTTINDNNTLNHALIGAQTLGGSASFLGDMAEIMVFASALSDANRQKIEGYLSHKYGLQAQLPSNHPYKVRPPHQGE